MQNEKLEDIFSKTDVIEEHKKIAQGYLLTCSSCKFNEVCGSGCPGVIYAAQGLNSKYADPVACRLFYLGLPILLEHASEAAKKHILELIRN